MGLSDVTADGVRHAIEEFDRLGREAFLQKYGFGRARDYFLLHRRKRYDSKAIVGAAHGYSVPEQGALGPQDFYGGRDSVMRILERLGFEVVAPAEATGTSRNPPWSREEVVLALDAYLKGAVPDKNDPRVIALSDELNRLQAYDAPPDEERYRNANGVALKIANFRALDPTYPGVGMKSGSRMDREVWNELASDPDLVADMADRIRSGLPALAPPHEDEPRQVASAPVESVRTVRFAVKRSEAGQGERREQLLVKAFESWLTARGHKVRRHVYSLPGSVGLACDLFDETERVLYEAKSSANREAVRMAIGQLLDYRRFEPAGTRIALLLPRRPAGDVVTLIESVGAELVWQEGEGFSRTP